MKTINIKLSKELKKLEIVTFADTHYGDSLCDVDLLKEKINYVKDNEHVFCILNGDLINNSTKGSVGDVYSEKQTPMDQLTTICELFEPIREKILCVNFGNHEARSWKDDGIDLIKLFCMQLGLIDRYGKESSLIFLKFGEQTAQYHNKRVQYTIFVTHGSGGGRREGSKLNRLAEMASIVDADIYIHSHTHLPMTMKQSFYRINNQSSTVKLVPKLFVNTAAMLNYGGYGEAAEFKPASKDSPHILLDGKIKKFTATL